MRISQFYYLPLPLPFFSILIGIFIVLIVILQVRAISFAYTSLGVSPVLALLLLLASLIGSSLNIPIAELPGQHVVSGQIVDFYGMRYVVPVVENWPGTIVAVNVGGGIIPSVMSLYLLNRYGLWVKGAVAIAIVAAVCNRLAQPTAGLGIALPIFVPVIITAVVALLLSRQRAAPLAYIAGSLGTLIGADLLNLGKIDGLGAPIASIGGAGTFDGIFLVGILAVLIAALMGGRDNRKQV